MDKSCQSSADSSITSSSSTSSDSYKDSFLKTLHIANKLSHKISKPNTNILQKKPSFDNNPQSQPQPSFSNSSSSINNVNTQLQSQQNQNQQQQPPVYNINKNDFRDVVQKLTGSPAHERYSTPPPIHPPKPHSSRLQRIRPPPLAHVTNRPPPLLNSGPPPVNAPLNLSMPIQRPPEAPLSPLPPFPTVHAAAESPVSAYMRYLQNTMGAGPGGADKQFSGFSPLAPLVSPRWNNLIPPPLQQQQPFPPPPMMTSSSNPPPLPVFQLPTSPLPFGCLNSPRSPHPSLSPGLIMSPTAFPLSPTLQVPSPRWRNL